MNSKILLLFILSVTVITQIYGQNKNETLDALIVEAINVSPKIKMLESKLDVFSARIEQGTNLPDPVIKLGLINLPTNSFSFTQEPMTGKTIGLTQAIPYPSGLSAAAKVKEIDPLIVMEEIKNQQNVIRKRLSRLYYELRLVRAEILLNEERISLLHQILEVVKAKSEVAEASMQNIIRVEVELTIIKESLQKLLGKNNAIVAEINAILLRDVDKPVHIDKIQMENYKIFTPTKLLESAKLNQPKLKEIKLSQKKSELMEMQAEYDFYPNFSIGVQYTQRDYSQVSSNDYNDLLSVTAGISLPINYGGKKTAKVNEAKYLQNLYREKYNSEVQDLNSSISVIKAKITELNNRYELISGTLLPLAEQSLQVALSDYQVGKIDFINVINAEKKILNVRTDLYRIHTDYDQNIVKLEFLVGNDLQDGTQSNGDLR